MTTRRLIISIILLVILLAPSLALADAFAPFGGHGLIPCDGANPNGELKPAPENFRVCNFDSLILGINGLIQFMLAIAVPLATIAFAYAGILYMTAAGNTGQLSKAHGIFKLVGTGLLFMFAAWLIVHTITSTLVQDQSFNRFLPK